MAKQTTSWRRKGRTEPSGDYDGSTIDYDSSTQKYAGNGETAISVIKQRTAWTKKIKNLTRFIKNPLSILNNLAYDNGNTYSGGCGIRIYIFAPSTVNTIEFDTITVSGDIYDDEGNALYSGQLCTYTFDGFSLAASSVATGLIVGDLLNNTSLPTFNTANGLGYPAEPVLTCAPKSGSTSEATAVSTGSYFEFIIDAQAGYTFTISDISAQAARGGGATPRGFVIRTSNDQYASNSFSTTLATQRPTFTSYASPLSGSGSALTYDSIVVGEPASTAKKATAWSKK